MGEAMNNLRKFTIAYILYGSFWWGAIGPLYYLARGLSMEQLYLLVAVYGFFVVLLEFPTGVLADRFSRQWSVTIGTLLSAGGLFLTALPGGFYFYLLIKILMAIGTSMVSGSNTALLHNISEDFKTDYARVKKYNYFSLFFFLNAGAWLYVVSPGLPFVLNGVSMLLAGVLYSQLKIKTSFQKDRNDTNKIKDNVYDLAGRSLGQVLRKKMLRKIVVLSAFFTGVFLNIKWFISPLLSESGFSAKEIGLVMSVGMLLMGFGAWLREFNRKWKLQYDLLIIVMVLGVVGFVYNKIILIFLFLLLFLVRSSFKIEMTFLVNKYVDERVRASVLSVENLISRLLSTVFIFSAGYVIGWWSFKGFSVFTVIWLMVAVSYFYFNKSLSKLLKQ